MPELNVPDAGLQLEGPNSETLSGVPRQAFPVEISHSVIEDMIRCVQDGQEIQLSLGSAPAFIYGPNMHHISPVPDSFPYDLYLTKPFEGLRKAQKLATTMSILKTPKEHAAAQAVRPPTTRGRATKGPPKPQNQTQAQTQAQTQTQPKKARAKDSGLEALQSSLSTAGAGKTQAATLVGSGSSTGSGSSGRSGGSGGDKGPGPKRGSVKAMGTVSSARTTPNSHASSPNPNGQPSPSMNPTPSASQRAVERAREQRFTLVHELAVQNQTKDYLRSRWSGKTDDFLAALEKVAEPAPDPAKYRMVTKYWKELDVHVYDYATQAERQTAIMNAAKQYDRMRLSQSDPLWDKLLPRDERGKGKCLSVLQAKLATGAGSTTANVNTPAIKVQSADDSMADAPTRDDDSLFGDDRPGRSGGAGAARSEPMSRSNSQPLPARGKRMTGSEAQAKRLLSTTTKRMAVTKNSALGRAGREKPAAAAAARDRPPGSGASGSNGSGGGSGSKTLSAEFIEDSDSDGHVPLAKGKAASTKARTAAAAAPPAAKPAAARPQSAKPAPRPQPAKRRREDEEEAAVDDSSSNSSTPLSKRLKAVPRPKPPASSGGTTTSAAAATRHRPSGASSQGSRPATARPGSSATATARNGHHGAAAAKNTAAAPAATTAASPAKSSPLATSSATNPSDVDDSERGRPAQKPAMKRRKMEPARPAATTTTSRTAAKKPAQLPRELVSKAVRFRGLYGKYAELHRKVGGMDNPSTSEMNSLHDMHTRLEILKRDIYLEAGDARA